MDLKWCTAVANSLYTTAKEQYSSCWFPSCLNTSIDGICIFKRHLALSVCAFVLQKYSNILHSLSHSLRLLSTSCRLITDLHKQNRAFRILSTAFTSQWVRIKISSASKAPHLNCLLKSRCHNTHSLFKAIPYSEIWIFFTYTTLSTALNLILTHQHMGCLNCERVCVVVLTIKRNFVSSGWSYV